MSEKPTIKREIPDDLSRSLGETAIDDVFAEKPKSKKVKQMNFHFRVGEGAKSFSLSSCDVGKFSRYQPRYRLLLAVGQSYSFDQDAITRNAYIERMFNKGATKPSRLN
jgi:hypothetical protein